MQLTVQQIDFIEADIQKRGLTQTKLIGEILDHICCGVEERMQEGMRFHQAYSQLLVQFGENGLYLLQKADKQALYKKRIIRKAGVMTTSIAACLLLFVTSIGNAQDIPDISPLKGNVLVTSSFGMRMHPELRVRRHHRGMDFRAAIGTPIHATADGVVVKVVTSPKGQGYGKRIVIAHGSMYETLYAHLSEFKVEVGQKVKKGEVIGLSGNSGKSKAPHLHYELHKGGKPVDPEAYFVAQK